MGLTFVSVIAIALLQTIFSGFSLWVFFDYIPVLLFCLRLVGATFKIKTLCILEGLPLAMWLIWDFMFGGFEYDWKSMIVCAVAIILTCGVFLYEDAFYMIVEKEERSDDDNEDS